MSAAPAACNSVRSYLVLNDVLAALQVGTRWARGAFTPFPPKRALRSSTKFVREYVKGQVQDRTAALLAAPLATVSSLSIGQRAEHWRVEPRHAGGLLERHSHGLRLSQL